MSTISEALAIGWTSFHAGDFPGAERVSRQVLQVDPSAAQVWYLLGTISHVQGQLGEAVAHYEQALRLEPQLIEVLNNLAVALQSQGKVDEAIAEETRKPAAEGGLSLDAAERIRNALMGQ